MIVDTIKKKKLGLALSGGGYRAAAFHLGVIRKLNNMELIDQVDVISTISGGSIAGAFYVLNKNNFEEFESTFKLCLQKSSKRRIIWNWRFLLPIASYSILLCLLFLDPLHLDLAEWETAFIFILTLIFLIFYQFRIISITALKINAYNKIFFKNKLISDLPEKPILAINSTNLSTGTLWTFSKNKCSDSSYEYPKDGGNSIKFDCSKMPIAKAVASSTSVPVLFDPVQIQIEYFIEKTDFKRVKPKLMDGGLYDNQGIHKITQKNSSYCCDIIIVSDGSQPFSGTFLARNTISILSRGIDVMMRKIKNLQFIRDVYSANKEIAYFSLDWSYHLCVEEFIKSAKNNQISPDILLYHCLDNNMLSKSNEELIIHISDKIKFETVTYKGLTDMEIKKISRIRTNLTALTIREIDLLSQHGEVLTELQIKLYCPSLLK